MASEPYYDPGMSRHGLPCVPYALGHRVKAAWCEAVAWEVQYYLDEEAPHTVASLSPATRGQLSQALNRLLKETYEDDCRHVFLEATLLLERLVLTASVSPGGMMRAAVACYLCRALSLGAYPCILDLCDRLKDAFDLDPGFNLLGATFEVIQEVGIFGEVPRMQTPADWFQRFLLSVPESRRPALPEKYEDMIFTTLGQMPSHLADHRPSIIAAAVLTFLMGPEEAEQYLCGYNLMDVSGALAEVRTVVTIMASNLNTVLPAPLKDL